MGTGGDSVEIIYNLGNISDWLTAIGTIGAVIIALYLSNKDRKPRVRVRSSLSHLVDPTGVSKDPIHISIEIVNLGLVPIHLKEATIQLKRGSVDRMVYLDESHRVDRLLQPGEYHEHKLDYQEIKNYYTSENIKK